MTGGVTPRVARMGRSPVAGCGAAAISKPWGMRRAETQTVAPRHLPKHLPDALPPAALPAWTQPGSSKDGGGGGVGDDSEFLQELYVMGFAWVALLRVQQTSLLCSIWGEVGLCLSVSFVCVWGGERPFTQSLLGSLFVGGDCYEVQNLVRVSDSITPSPVHSHSDSGIYSFAAAVSHPGSIPGVPSLATAVPSPLDR